MTSHVRRPLVAATVFVLATTALTAGAGTPASAGLNGTWTQISTGAGAGLSNPPSVTRFGTSLVVAWNQASGTTAASLKTRVIGSNALPTGPESTVLTWSELSSDPAVFLLGGKPTIAFGGLRSLDSTDPFTGPMAYVQSADGVTWAQGPGSLTQTRSAYGDYGIGAVDDGAGQPLVALAASSTDRVTVHHGVDPSVPAAAPDTEGTPTGEAQAVSLVRDAATSASYAAWYSGATGANNGIHSQQVWPTMGPVALGPLSQTPYAGAPTSINPGQNVAVASRAGGGAWAAYGSGYPSAHRVVLWNLGTTRTISLTRSGAVQYVGISPGPGGRMWVWWVEGGAVFASRTNPAVTTFGVVRRVTAPKGASPTRTAGDGSLGPLDLVINAAPDGVTSELFSTRLVEGLQVKATPVRLRASRGGKVTVVVTDAGVPVRGAVVRSGSVTRRTDRHGRATLPIPAGATKGARAVTAAAVGYANGLARVRVR